MKITICTYSYVEVDVSSPIIEKAYEAHNKGATLTEKEYLELKETISSVCGLPYEEDYENKDAGLWSCVYAEDDTLIYE